MSIELYFRVRLRVDYFDLAHEIKFINSSISMASYWIILKAMLVHWSVDRFVRFPFTTCLYL